MSIDPLAAGVADPAALIDAEIAVLAADAQALRAELVQGAVVAARVLASNGLTDLLEIAGRRVAASLPPGPQPGDTLAVQVTGFDGDRILLQIVAPRANAPSEALPSASSSSAASSSAVLPPAAPATTAPAAGTAFVRAAVLPAAPEPGAARSPDPEVAAQPVVPRPVVVSSGLNPIEVRLAAARAADAGTPVQPSAESVPPPRFVVAPPIAARVPDTESPRLRAPQPAPAAALAGPAPHVVRAAPALRAGLSAYTEPAAMLRALRLPVTPTTIASATLALAHPDRLPAALQTLERALPRAAVEPQVATLRTLLAFVGRIDPRSPVLAAQIAAYVDHVVDGGEPKLAALLAARAAPPDAVRTGAPVLAVAAERSAALGGDLKQTMLAVAADPATPRAAAPALAGALAALTAVQIGAAQTLAANPGGIAFALPLVTEHGAAHAQVRVSRDAPGRRGRVDGDNFRIAFVLDTAHFGTIAIDLVTVGRDVTVDVRAESSPAVRAFRDALGGLTARLEALRYRVASANATIGVTTAVELPAAPRAPRDLSAVVDRSA